MADKNVTRLKIVCTGSNGNTTTFSYNYADGEPSQSTITTLCDALIENGDIFQNKPVAVKSASIVATVETDFTPPPNP